MGLTHSSTGRKAAPGAAERERAAGCCTVALAGNPNVGKSTVFNSLTGMNQHTGNWPGKTVASARGFCRSESREYMLVDIPGAYSLMAHSPEEEIARDFLCFGGADAVALVCDATCLERNMNLVLQTMELSRRVLVCVNLLDEAERRKIRVDLDGLSQRLGVPVIGIVAREKSGRETFLRALDALMDAPPRREGFRPHYPQAVEESLSVLAPLAAEAAGEQVDSRWLSLRLLAGDEELTDRVDRELGGALESHPRLIRAAEAERIRLSALGLDREALEDALTAALVKAGEELCRGVVSFDKDTYGRRDRRIDRLVTGRLLGYPLMLLLLAIVFYLTISGANYPSQWLSALLFGLEEPLSSLLVSLGAPAWLRGILVEGAYRVLAWVVSVMLPPMAIFFPLFTLLEDAGYLPRVAYNLDRPFCRCGACGKQALTMCLPFFAVPRGNKKRPKAATQPQGPTVYTRV